nr:lycopene cyclase family protein [Streptomyces sulfonofaciens]
MLDASVAVVGAGAAGLSLARWLARGAPGRGPAVVLLDAPPGPLRPPPRTWCFWEADGGEFDAALTASWTRLRVTAPDGRPIVRTCLPLRYKMLRSADFERTVLADAAVVAGVRRLTADVARVDDRAGGALVHGTAADGSPLLVGARWVFDSRPPAARPPRRTELLQHFRGWFVRSDADRFDPRVVDLMDFRLPQPRRGLAFGYVLPISRREALVEYTQFSSDVLTTEAYDRALNHYIRDVLGLGGLRITGTETGVIPMTDAPLHRQTGRSVFRIGTAGGATRASTGYTFSAAGRQARAVAAACRAGRRPVPPACYPARARAMDAVLLHALATGRVDGAALLSRLFEHIPTERLLRFMDGRTRLHEDISVGVRTPVAAMLRTTAALLAAPRRPPGDRTPRTTGAPA